MSYAVYVNRPTSKVRIHRTDCPFYITRKADETDNGFWKAFKNFNDALNFATNIRKQICDTCDKCIGKKTCYEWLRLEGKEKA